MYYLVGSGLWFFRSSEGHHDGRKIVHRLSSNDFPNSLDGNNDLSDEVVAEQRNVMPRRHDDHRTVRLTTLVRNRGATGIMIFRIKIIINMITVIHVVIIIGKLNDND